MSVGLTREICFRAHTGQPPLQGQRPKTHSDTTLEQGGNLREPGAVVMHTALVPFPLWFGSSGFTTTDSGPYSPRQGPCMRLFLAPLGLAGTLHPDRPLP